MARELRMACGRRCAPPGAVGAPRGRKGSRKDPSAKVEKGFTDRMAKKGIEIITINYSLITSFFACPNRALEREGLGGCARTSVACKTKSETGKPRVSAGSSPRGFTARLLRMAM